MKKTNLLTTQIDVDGVDTIPFNELELSIRLILEVFFSNLGYCLSKQEAQNKNIKCTIFINCFLYKMTRGKR